MCQSAARCVNKIRNSFNCEHLNVFYLFIDVSYILISVQITAFTYMYIVQCPVLIAHVFIYLVLHFFVFYLLKLMLTDFCKDCRLTFIVQPPVLLSHQTVSHVFIFPVLHFYLNLYFLFLV